jgi:hyperosmotically inducible periplasmic protein
MARIRDWFAPILATAMLVACAGTNEHVDDATLAAKVRTALQQDQQLKGFPIDVESHNDVVQLSGAVHTPQDADRAQEIAVNVPGVRTVYNRLTVK